MRNLLRLDIYFNLRETNYVKMFVYSYYHLSSYIFFFKISYFNFKYNIIFKKKLYFFIKFKFLKFFLIWTISWNRFVFFVFVSSLVAFFSFKIPFSGQSSLNWKCSIIIIIIMLSCTWLVKFFSVYQLMFAWNIYLNVLKINLE